MPANDCISGDGEDPSTPKAAIQSSATVEDMINELTKTQVSKQRGTSADKKKKFCEQIMSTVYTQGVHPRQHPSLRKR
jgi:hypothetical protein